MILGKAADKICGTLSHERSHDFQLVDRSRPRLICATRLPCNLKSGSTKPRETARHTTHCPKATSRTRSIDKLAHDLVDTGLQAVSIVCAGAFTEPDTLARKRRIAHLRFSVQSPVKIGASWRTRCPW